MKKNITLMPKAQEALTRMGTNIRLARLRRNISADLLAQRAGISVVTLRSIENGLPSVSMGNYMAVLFSLGQQDDMAAVCANDRLGRDLQDIGMPERVRVSSRRGFSA